MDKIKILFVDDNELNRMVMHDMLEMLFEDFIIETYESAKEVLELDINSYNLILSDIDMPEMDGFELYNKLRELNFTNPIIAVTALAVSGDKEKMLMHGFDSYISKPVDMKMLEQTIEEFVK